MPAVSQKQERLMQAAAHSPEFARKVGIPQSVGKEFTKDEEGESLEQIGGDDLGIITDAGVLIEDYISPNISLTPEGYLLCSNAVMARTGTYTYSSKEIPQADPDDNDEVIAYRNADEVFRPESMASFEGKPVTLEHPREMVGPDTWKRYAVGIIQNVRAEGSLLKADLLITDTQAIKQIQDNGLKKLSCGYTSELEIIGKGKVNQTMIKGNHVALVLNPRAGDVCTITDAKQQLTINTTKKGNTMTNKEQKQKTLFRSFFKFLDAYEEEKLKDDYVQTVKDDDDDDDDDDKVVESEEMDEDQDIKTILNSIVERLNKIEEGVAKNAEAEAAEVESKDDDMCDDDDDAKLKDDDESKEEEEAEGEYPLGDSFDTVISKAEIMVPGIKLKTSLVDSGDKKALLQDHKKQTLKQLYLFDGNRTLVDKILGTMKLEDVNGLALDVLFNAVAVLKGIENNAKMSSSLSFTDAKRNKDINTKLAEVAALHKAKNSK